MRILIAFSAFAALTLAAAPEVPNAGFEQVKNRNAAGWGGKGNGTLCSENPHSGKYAYKVTGKANLWSQKLIPVEPEHRYRLKVFTRSTVIEGGCSFGLYESSSPKKPSKEQL